MAPCSLMKKPAAALSFAGKKPGSSYTFSIAERIGLDARLISRTRKLVDESHFKLDKLLNSTELGICNSLKDKKKRYFAERK